MSGKSAAKAAQFASNLPHLQNLMKRDPISYKDEFWKQWQYFHSLMQTFQLQPSKYNEKLDEMITFLAQVSHCYKEEVSQLPETLSNILKNHSTTLDRTMRMTLIKAVIMLRNKDLISATSVLQLFFKLLRCEDKLLRKTIYQYVVSDIKNINAKHKNARLNSALQTYMFSVLQETNGVMVKTALDIMIELYKRNIWNDAKTVNVITTACFSKITKVMVAAIKFFLGKDVEEQNEDSDSETEEPPKKTAKTLTLGHRVAKKTKKRKKKLERALEAVKKHNKNKSQAEAFNFSALHLIHDPQDFAEKLFRQLEKSTERFEVKLMMIDLISRLVGIHKLILLNFYPFMKRFVQPHQREVTRLLLYLAQGSHEVVPPDAVEEVLKAIANNFITERNSSEVMAVGLNAVREICARCPLAMSDDLLQDLVQYRTHRDKAVIMAARSLIQLYRKVNPELLHRKDRGRPTEAMKELKVLSYGQTEANSFVSGAEVIPDMEAKKEQAEHEQGEWESCSEEDDDSDGEWVDVYHSSDEEAEKDKPEETEEDQKLREKKAEEVSTTRIMTDEDFKAINMAQISKDINPAKSSANRRKRKRQEALGDENSRELPTLGDIELVHKKKAHDRESRLATVAAGREGREKFSHGPQKMNPHASTTNKDKAKKKVFTMVKHKIRRKKVKRSFKEKQIALRNSLIKRNKNARK
ncbi:protein sda1 homolog [Plakobranchus ocellatus]|uniref:Protein SDA1 n=1 Tax=Plakobranchus ocellatus TaxID=259542 RepID=A0AAV4B8S6_9GAST|nr:protein sda1 homolog [Plakobranchus ocellatus]